MVNKVQHMFQTRANANDYFIASQSESEEKGKRKELCACKKVPPPTMGELNLKQSFKAKASHPTICY